MRRMIVAACLAWTACLHAQDLSGPLAKIKAVGKEGAGNAEAAVAWKAIVAEGPKSIPVCLAALDDASPAAANWIRSAIETVAEKELAAGRKLDASMLEGFVKETKHAGPARRLAYEYLTRIDPATPKRLLPTMLDDPGAELRRDAVGVLLEEADKHFKAKEKDSALKTYRKALVHARERDQVQLIADRLEKLGEKIDLTKHFGFITRWAWVGPFDNRKGVGFKTAYPPEKSQDLKNTYTGKEDAKVQWKETETAKAMGIVDLNDLVGKLKGAVAYAYAAVESPVEKQVEVRCGSNNAVRIWLNGKEIYFREEYHHGMQMDQHVSSGTLKAGRNEILIKVCQNEQTEDWAQLWSFQVRITDHLGGAVPVTVVTERLPAAKQ
ncbi:MAG: hypothetical protein K2X38_08975 [Gemmataceae bacterium]|nr:hypothetical protein [Gemmataceae bacterium]